MADFSMGMGMVSRIADMAARRILTLVAALLQQRRRMH